MTTFQSLLWKIIITNKWHTILYFVTYTLQRMDNKLRYGRFYFKKHMLHITIVMKHFTKEWKSLTYCKSFWWLPHNVIFFLTINNSVNKLSKNYKIIFINFQTPNLSSLVSIWKQNNPALLKNVALKKLSKLS